MPKTSYQSELNRMVRVITDQFHQINRRRDLTDEDKTKLKNYLLEHFTTPRAKKLLAKHFPTELPKTPQPTQHSQQPRQNPRPNPHAKSESQSPEF